MSEDPYPFESEDDIEIRELELESVDAVAEARVTIGELAGENQSWRYGHVIVDEAQDLTPMQWRMVMRRVRGRSLTIVGDLAQRSASTAGSWEELLPPELHESNRQDLTINYRSPAEIHELAVAVLAEFAPTVAPSRAIRESGLPPSFMQVTSIDAAVKDQLEQMRDLVGGQIAVIGNDLSRFDAPDDDRVRYLTPSDAKGLEFDAVVLVEPAQILSERGPAALYIALTRSTQRLSVLYRDALPTVLSAT